MIDAVLSHLRSRKFRIAVIVILVNLLVVKVPELAPYRDALILSFTAVAVTLIHAIAKEDAAALQEAGDASTLTEAQAMDDIRETIRETVGELLETVFKVAPPKQ